MREGVQGDDVGVAHLQEGLLLGVQVHELVLLEYLLFAHDLEGVDLGLAPELDQLDPPKGAVAQGGEDLEVVALKFAEDQLTVLLEGCEFVFLHILHNRYR